MHQTSYAEITKLTADSYQFYVVDQFRQVNEIVDDAKLMGMLSRESLVSEDGNPLRAEDVANFLDGANVGYKMRIALVKRVA